MAGQSGDIMSALSVMKYRQELWGDCKIVWYADLNNFDLFKYQDIEVREFPRGFGYPQMVIEENKKLVAEGKEPVWEDWSTLVDENNMLNIELAKSYPSLHGIQKGYFPAPHQIPVPKRHNISYPNCSKKVFCIPDHYEWHPVLSFSPEEIFDAGNFMSQMPTGKIVMLETMAGSSQSKMDEEMVLEAMRLCNEHWGECSFVFASHKFLRLNQTFPAYLFEQKNIYSCAKFTVRQCALISENCDLLLSVSSGITVASSAWDIQQPPTVQFCGSEICSTQALANGYFKLVTADGKSMEEAKKHYYEALIETLNKYK